MFYNDSFTQIPEKVFNVAEYGAVGEWNNPYYKGHARCHSERNGYWLDLLADFSR